MHTYNRRPQIDYCNICGKKDRLTKDHVPPKSCGNNITQKYNLALGINDSSAQADNFLWTSQGGLAYQSICSACNNKLLGSKYDTEYKTVYDEVSQIAKSTLSLPKLITIECSVNRYARSIIGHFLSAKNYYDKDCIVDTVLRNYFLNENSPPPPDFHLYYYPYPYASTLILRDAFAISNKAENDTNRLDGMFSCINSFPLAFLLTDRNINLAFSDLFFYCNHDIDARKRIPIRIDTALYNGHFRHPQWPCNVGNEEVKAIVFGKSLNDTVFSVDK